MRLPSILTAIRTPALRLWAWLLLCALYLAQAPAYAGEVHKFDGNKVKGCQLDGKAYTCANLPSTNWDDSMSISSGYSVHVKSNVVPGWDYGLTMSGSARLTSAGAIDLSQINPAKISIAGGSFDAVGEFKVGGPVNVTANVSAGSLVLGTGPQIQITGSMVSRGAVSIASAVTINGSVSGTQVTTNSSVRISGSITSTGTVYIGSASTIGAGVSGASITTDSSVTIVGAVTSTGPVSIGSHANIDGAIKGTVVTTNSPVVLKGDIAATSRFTLASGSTVNGNITSPEVDMYAASSIVTGKVTASKYLTMGSAVRINGDVDTGQLRLEASETIINGNAAVDFATLFWHGRVSQKIFCKSGTRPGYCDCVDNQSGYEVNTANGPRCEAVKPPATGLHHFLITHDGSAGTCAVEYVKVSACANADCSTLYNGGATVTMAPGGKQVTIDASGVNTAAEVSNIATGKVNLSLTQGSTKPTVACFNGKSNSCEMEFTGGANFSISELPDHKAGHSVTAIIKALKANDSQSACVPAFVDVKAVQYSCDYVSPSTGSGEMTVTSNEGATGSFACKASASLNTRFNEKGEASVNLSYLDAGKVALKATLADVETVKGRKEFIVAPDRFELSAIKPLRAGADFKVALTAVNKSGATTPNFNAATLTALATQTEVALDCVASGVQGSLTAVKTEFAAGKASATLNYSEAGYLDLRATHTKFLASKLDTTGTTGGSANGPCQAKAGPFVPAYFQVELKDDNRKKTNFFYSGEPIPLKLSARNAQGQVTKNYPSGHGSGDTIRFSAIKVDGTAFAPAEGVITGEFEAKHFISGETVNTAPQPRFTFNNAQHAPLQIRLRADNQAADANLRIDSAYAPTDPAIAKPEQALPFIRTGRLRLGKRFGRVGTQPLQLPVTVEFWSGKSWVVNTQDSYTVIPGSAFAQTPGSAGGATPAANNLPEVKIVNGSGILSVLGNVPGWIDIAINLGPDQQDTSCLTVHPASTGAKQAWLRSPLACNGQWGSPAIDPSARATFGVFPVDNRRIIHVREVFN
ncbi:DUF6701 domain-containing protein [Telluria beijingensis]|uniref:DUF6701 domain-containing protein n=1 Tax=Telluria beijingensis TaxID=3068633 RepID=UPI002795BBFB|nr:DUF6701 domain-containing protein [Massilia sp. REN29]